MISAVTADAAVCVLMLTSKSFSWVCTLVALRAQEKAWLNFILEVPSILGGGRRGRKEKHSSRFAHYDFFEMFIKLTLRVCRDTSET